MAKSLPRTRLLPLVGRDIAFGTIVTMTFACAQADPVSPERRAPLQPITSALPVVATSSQGPQACMPDSKLIGRFAASTADVPGTWWRLTKERFDALGVTDYKAALEGFYGQSFNTLADAIQYLIDGVAAWDANGNGHVCAYEVRGMRSHLGVNALFLLGIADDKHVDD